MGDRIIPNAKYLLSVRAKLKSATASSDNLKLTLKIEDDAPDGLAHWRGISTTIYSERWTLLEGYVEVDVTGTLNKVKLFAEGPAIGVDFWVDDFSAVFVEMLEVTTTGPSGGPTNVPTRVSSIVFLH